MDELPYLPTFVKAAELSNFTAAARELGVTQAAVSQHIQALEKALKIALFSRQGGRVVLTQAGRSLYDFALRIRALHREAREFVSGQALPREGDLHLAASSIPGEHLLPGPLALYREKHPHIRVKVTVQDTQAVLTLIEQGKAHLGVVGGRIDHADLEFRTFASDHLVLITNPAHRWGRRKRVCFTDLREESLIVREAGSGSRWCLEQGLAGAGCPLGDLKVVLELSSNEAIKEAVLKGAGAAFLSEHAVAKELKDETLHAVAVTGLRLQRDLFIVLDRRRVLPPPADLFLRSLF